MTIKNITLGSDPEYACFDQNGTPRSAVGFIPGTKKEPFQLEDQWSCQIDNVGAEMCIPVCTTEEEFVHAMLHGKYLVEKKIQEMQPNWTVRSVSSARYSQEELNSDTARMFGCEPSYCVYTQEQSPRPHPSQVGNLRSFGCHIHIGYQTDDRAMDAADKIIRAMDICVGLGSVIIDTDSDRRSIYGNAGDLRFRQVEDVNIVEYRTLGGAMHLDEERLSWVYKQTMKAVEMVNNWSDFYQDHGKVVEEAINTGDEATCRELMGLFNISLPTTYDSKLQYVIG
jgi:hypothetical protein